MRHLIKPFLVEALGLYAANKVAAGLAFSGLQSIIITIAALTLASRLVKPIVNVLILPLTLATLGLFKFVGSAITLYIVDLVLPHFSVSGFDFDGLATPFFEIPPLLFGEGALSYIAFSIVLSFATGFVHWAIK